MDGWNRLFHPRQALIFHTWRHWKKNSFGIRRRLCMFPHIGRTYGSKKKGKQEITGCFTTFFFYSFLASYFVRYKSLPPPHVYTHNWSNTLFFLVPRRGRPQFVFHSSTTLAGNRSEMSTHNRSRKEQPTLYNGWQTTEILVVVGALSPCRSSGISITCVNTSL